jgi:hypothetical protein
MKAKIQFTVDMEDIPEEVRNRIERVFYKAENTSVEVKNILGDISENNIVVATQKIDKVRKDLAFIDSVLEDGYNILSGYAAYQIKQLESKTPEKKQEQENE